MARVPSLFSPGSLLGGSGDPYLALHREMNRLFDDVLRGGQSPSGQGMSQGVLLVPHTDISETDQALCIQAELPGVSESDIDVSLAEDIVTIRAEKKQEQTGEREGVHLRERSFGIFQRSLRLPFQVNPDQVQAHFANGVLSVMLPKAQQQERIRRIQVKGEQPRASTAQEQVGEQPTTTQR